MNIETIRVVSPESSDNLLGFIVINRTDFDPAKHEPFGDDLGTSMLVERAPTMAELLAAGDQLLERERSLDAEKERIAAQEQRLADQAQANEVEAQRLRDEAAALAAGAVANSQVTSLSKEQLQTALDHKGIKYSTAANKAELQALLGA